MRERGVREGSTSGVLGGLLEPLDDAADLERRTQLQIHPLHHHLTVQER